LESQGVLFESTDAKMGVSLHIHIYYVAKMSAIRGILKAGLDPNGSGWRQVIAGGLNAMDEIDPGLGQWARCVDELADAIEVVIVATEVGYAMKTIWTREVQNVGIAGLVPGDLFRCEQLFAKGKCLTEN